MEILSSLMGTQKTWRVLVKQADLVKKRKREREQEMSHITGEVSLRTTKINFTALLVGAFHSVYKNMLQKCYYPIYLKIFYHTINLYSQIWSVLQQYRFILHLHIRYYLSKYLNPIYSLKENSTFRKDKKEKSLQQAH